MELFTEDNLTALEAQKQAYWISLAPMVFQASRVLRNTGILQCIKESQQEGVSLEQIVERVDLPRYSVRVLLHAGLGIGLVRRKEQHYVLTKTGVFFLRDKPVQVNMDFTHDVCYQGMFYLEESIMKGKPEGLKVFGDWSTIYEGLSQLPEQVQKSWFDFDHYFSDGSFPKAIPHILERKPGKLMDIGGNTGKFSIELAQASSDSLKITLVDLPGQVNMAKQNVAEQKLEDRIAFHPVNLLEEGAGLPKGYDAIWMSQFLDCFSEEEIVSILSKCFGALNEGGRVFILDSFWDKQRFESPAFSLLQTNLYFTAMANGNSQFYDFDTFKSCIEKAGFEVEETHGDIGLSNTLLVCKKKDQ